VDLRLVDGDLLDQDVEVIVNAWNRNLIPWWLLIPQGVSRAIKRRHVAGINSSEGPQAADTPGASAAGWSMS
jgi:hypothetical protein